MAAQRARRACAKACESGVHERMVSVRPCLKAAVEADSYLVRVRVRFRLRVRLRHRAGVGVRVRVRVCSVRGGGVAVHAVVRELEGHLQHAWLGVGVGVGVGVKVGVRYGVGAGVGVRVRVRG